MEKETKIESINKELNNLSKKNEILNQNLKELKIISEKINSEDNVDIKTIVQKYENENAELKLENKNMKE